MIVENWNMYWRAELTDLLLERPVAVRRENWLLGDLGSAPLSAELWRSLRRAGKHMVPIIGGVGGAARGGEGRGASGVGFAMSSSELI